MAVAQDQPPAASIDVAEIEYIPQKVAVGVRVPAINDHI
jgi:hypothetical protein